MPPVSSEVTKIKNTNPTQATSQELCVNNKVDERQFPFPSYFLHNFFIVFSKWVQTVRMPDPGSFTSLRTTQNFTLSQVWSHGSLTSAAGTPSGGRQCSTIMPSMGTSLPCGSCSKFFRKSAKKVWGPWQFVLVHICSKYNKIASLMSQTRYTQKSQWISGIPEEENCFAKYSQAHLNKP